MSEIIKLIERLAERVQQLELNREFAPRPIMVSEADTIADLVSLAALKFDVTEKAIKGREHSPIVAEARKWVCTEAHLVRHIPLSMIGWLLGKRDHSTIHAIIHGKVRK